MQKNIVSFTDAANLLTSSIRRREEMFIVWYCKKQIAVGPADSDEVYLLVDGNGEYRRSVFNGTEARQLKGLGIPFEKTQEPNISLEDTKRVLAACFRGELVDHAFGDAEVSWYVVQQAGDVERRLEIADGYYGSGADVAGFTSDDTSDGADRPALRAFQGRDARALRKLGHLASTTRNDETGPDTYREGVCMPGLTLEGVRRELTSPACTCPPGDVGED